MHRSEDGYGWREWHFPGSSHPHLLQSSAGIDVWTLSPHTHRPICTSPLARYHIASGEEVAFARLPYANRDLGVGIRVTRFVALGPISGAVRTFVKAPMAGEGQRGWASGARG